MHGRVCPGRADASRAVARRSADRYHVTMSNWERQSPPVMALPKPGRTLKAILLTLFGVWLMFAMAFIG